MEPTAKRRKLAPTTSDHLSEASSSPFSLEGTSEQGISISSPLETQNNPDISSGDIICFGMLLNIPTLKSQPGSPPSEDVEVRHGGEIFSTTSNALRGTESMEMDLRIFSIDSFAKTGSRQYTLQAILYGDEDLGDGLKEILRGQNLFLQDPWGANRDAVYINPQRYCNSPGIRTSDFHITTNDTKATEEQINPTDFLAEFTSGDVLSETQPSQHVKTTLKAHQKQALSFMLSRERGWNLETRDADIWSLIQNNRQTAHEFINNVNGSSQYVSPPDFRGGIIADNMGSGKTLSMIALIAHDRILFARTSAVAKWRPTIVIVPPPLLNNWLNELSSHLYDAEFKWTVHHGQSKITDGKELQGIDIVLTTYPTVATEWRNKGRQSVLFSNYWHRVILDEAHNIKNPSTATTKAVYEIASARRWAEPILIPDKTTFNEEIKSKLSSGGEEEGINRLKRLLGFLMLRRTNSVILPDRKDFVRTVEFDVYEQAAYEQAAETTLECIDSSLRARNAKSGYTNALQKINTLRRICNLGHLNSGDFQQDASLMREDIWDQPTAQRALDQFPMLGLNSIHPLAT
ncbi:DNA repair protein rad5 [Fusarium austroafricanum]|uniref:DNA repair protein rad5 n=1 Tax=Fusarium austroafricanum TaxID=2364996 RepID=A0A8H4PE13_9HYPO|nr:DNA repair protein rad5 [Fusarium austroafricanum]